MLRVFEAFSGIGTQRMALRNLGIEHEVVCIAEIDKFAIRSYEAIHGETLNLGDVSKIDPNDVPDHDLFTYSFPCQDISVAGKGKGFKPESGTRSSLLWECEKIIEAKKPKYLLMENVKALIFKKFKPGFEKWLRLLEELGYTNYWQVLNAKDYGIPQNRERVFCVSILGTHEPYVFPKKQELKLRLKDLLEDEVDEKFYLSEEHTKRFTKSIKSDKFPFGNEYKVVGTTKAETERMGTNSRHWVYDTNDCMSTLDATMYKQPKQILEPSINQVGMLDIKGNEQIRRVYGANGISPTLNSMQGGNRQPKVMMVGKINSSQDGIVLEKVVCEQRTDEGLRFFKDDVCGTIRTIDAGGDKRVIERTVNDTNKLMVVGNTVPSEHTAGKAIRKDYESGKIKESRHNMTELTPREDGISNTLTTVQKDNLVVEQVRALAKTARPNTEIGVTLRPNGDIRPHRMDIKKSGIQELNINHEDNPSHTVTSAHMPKVYGDTTNFRIRKLTPKECWRLMGISDEDFEKAQEVNSNTQLYKQAGNAIVVDVLEGIFRKLFLSKSKEKGNKLEEQLEWLDDLLGVGKVRERR